MSRNEEPKGQHHRRLHMLSHLVKHREAHETGKDFDKENERNSLMERLKARHRNSKEQAEGNPAHVKLLSQKFDFIDKNHSGFLTKDEICACLELFGFNTEESKSFIKRFDQNKDGKISKQEFMDAVHKIKKSQVTEAQLRVIFRKADTNNSGKICTKELQDYLAENRNIVSKSQVQAWIKQHDEDGDGELDYEEFLSFLREHL
ncbi:unnamed protein product [Echinostoma caproni]|uniref:Calmodulin n=1 Tax=Echinostoma caproni TaxID=27848 RepID=A0A183AJL8_9TREM|nr:unnamed protein product [Echinostoma caproni]